MNAKIIEHYMENKILKMSGIHNGELKVSSTNGEKTGYSHAEKWNYSLISIIKTIQPGLKTYM